MFQQIKLLAFLGIGGFVAYSVFLAPQQEQTADLGQVLDRTEYVLTNYQGYLGENNVTEVGDAQMAEFTAYYTDVLNAEPRFYGKTLGLEVQNDASFLGFADANGNGIQDAEEGRVFTVEIDEENQRLIATDVAGNSTGLRFSGSGILAGVLIGSLINRQRGAGISKSSFANRSVTPRASYSAPSSARSGGPRAGK